MITGFNTYIEYQGVTYHVQTEDKGTSTPLILSLVYNGGTIFASKRSHYDDLLLKSFDEKVLAEHLQRQHNLICAAIGSGRIEDLKRMSMKTSDKKTPDLIVEKATKKVESPKLELPIKIEIAKKPKIDEDPQLDIPQPRLLKETTDKFEDLPREQTFINLEQILDEERIDAERRAEIAIPKPKPKIRETETKEDSEEIIIEAVEIIEDVEIISADAVEIIEEDTPPQKTPVNVSPSQKLSEDLTRMQSASANNSRGGELSIKLVNDEDFYSGDEKTLKINVFRGTEENSLGGTFNGKTSRRSFHRCFITPKPITTEWQQCI